MLSPETLLNKIEKYLHQAEYTKALKGYRQLYLQHSTFFDWTQGHQSQQRRTHIQNAANLSRREAYERFRFLERTSDRLGQSLAHFLGLSPRKFQKKEQRPNFFYIPDLPTKPYFRLQEIPRLAGYIKKLNACVEELNLLSERVNEKYTENFSSLPATPDWNEISEKWSSSHLVKKGEATCLASSVSPQLQALLSDDILAWCPPHSPEVFVSVLAPGAYIPPHYGISNCRLTVHLPIAVTPGAKLEVAGEKFEWSEGKEALIFDDSFLHSAANISASSRAVLIFDVWNPYLSRSEREAIKEFMAKYEDWNSDYGFLASADKNLYQ